MCQLCIDTVAKAGTILDDMMESEKRFRATEPDMSEPQFTMLLANRTIDVLNAYPTGEAQQQGVMDLALSFATLITRVIAAEQIHGVRFS